LVGKIKDLRLNFWKLAQTFSPVPTEMRVLFDAYLAPCWIKRSVRARLDNNRYPLPSHWITVATGTAAPPSAQHTGKAGPYARPRKNLMRAEH